MCLQDQLNKMTTKLTLIEKNEVHNIVKYMLLKNEITTYEDKHNVTACFFQLILQPNIPIIRL